jgi:pimeloyl-ACP methyl ester carboxylesterase
MINYRKINGNDNENKILIFLPGIGASIDNYEIFARKLINYYSCIYLIDLPSQGSFGEWKIGIIVDMLRIFIEKYVNENTLHLAGHSAGALAILSYFFNYNSETENKISTLNLHDKTRLWNQVITMEPVYVDNVEAIHLYAIPYNFKLVFPAEISNYLSRSNSKFVKFILNSFVNWPQKLIRILNENDYSVDEKIFEPCIRYHNLVIDDHKAFFNYIAKYETLFQHLHLNSLKSDQIIKSRFSGINIAFHYGTFDWIIKPYSKSYMIKAMKILLPNKMQEFQYKGLGHLLNNKYQLDINLNTNMLRNEDVIKNTIKTIERTNGNKRVPILHK